MNLFIFSGQIILADFVINGRSTPTVEQKIVCDCANVFTRLMRIRPMLHTNTVIKLLTEQEVSTLIRKSVHWLRRKRWEGGSNSIPYRKLGSSVRYAETNVLNWIQQHTLLTSTSEGGVSCN